MSRRLGYEVLHSRAFWQWTRRNLHIHQELRNLFHIPNEGRRSPIAASVLKSMGLVSGVWDYLLAHAEQKRGVFVPGLWIEMKSPGSALTNDQLEWGRLMRFAGYELAVCYDWPQAATAVLGYLGRTNQRCATTQIEEQSRSALARRSRAEISGKRKARARSTR